LNKIVIFINNNTNYSNMDIKDRKILYELSLNSRIPLNKLAKIINANPTTTLYRIQKLKDQEILLGTQAIIDNSILGFFGYRIYIRFCGITTNQQKDIFEWLIKQKEVSVLTTTTGAIDCVIISWTKSRLEFHNFVQFFKEKYQEFIADLEISDYVKVHHFARDYLLDTVNNPKIITIGNKEKIESYDDIDIKILQILSIDARKSALDISKEIHMQPKTIIDRIKKLEKKEIIKGYNLNLNIEKIGYEYHKVNIIFNKNINYKKLLNYTSTIKNSVYVDEATTKYDYELNLEVKNSDERDKIVNNIKDEFQGIKEIKYFQIKKFLKMTYIPI